MKAVPILRCKNMEESLSFYTTILGFALTCPEDTPESPVVDLIRGEAQLQLSVLRGDGAFGSAVNIVVDEVDELFKTLVERGLDTSARKNSPVHQGPVDQTWGRREFYVDDPSGNTMRFTAPIR
jgi:catechol 2,3-dioxygenase-like lactoylglutathione lyase family enzyme